ncbi:MAG: PhzF family phenazine biosynthesis protein [Vulcanimicrobiota bacterium]
MDAPFFWIDAFTPTPFGGNPAAVCLLTSTLEDEVMQQLAAEFGLSETAFLWPEREGFRLRWFTPTREVRLCGHATVAAATALWSQDQELTDLTFFTVSGTLEARQVSGKVQLTFPSRSPAKFPIPQGLVEALGIAPDKVQWCGRDEDDYLLLLPSEEDIRSLNPDFQALREIETRGTIVTARSSTPEIDFVSRFFAPQVGVDEDPVTGSAHCCLAAFWAEPLNKRIFQARQLSPRGGQLEVELARDRVHLRGESYVLVSGTVSIL